jgi:hypothetical protein
LTRANSDRDGDGTASALLDKWRSLFKIQASRDARRRLEHPGSSTLAVFKIKVQGPRSCELNKNCVDRIVQHGADDSTLCVGRLCSKFVLDAHNRPDLNDNRYLFLSTFDSFREIRRARLQGVELRP